MRMSRLRFALFVLPVLMLAAAPGFAQPLANNKSNAKAIDVEKFSSFEKLVNAEIEKGKIVGCSALLMKDGKQVYTKTFGQRDRKKELPVAKDTIWRIYSMSKPITSVAVMQLVERGKIKLDDKASIYLPEFKDLKVLQGDAEVPCDREMTIRDLLRHTSGLTYGFFGNSAVDQQYKKARVMVFDKNLAETVSKLGKIPLLHQPGTRFHYSLSTDVLGRVVEVVSKKPFKDYLDEELFKPLEMNDTFFTVPKDKRERFAEMYRPDGKGGLKTANRMSSYRFLNKNELYSGGGGLCSTAGDYVNFCQMLVNDGKHNDRQILKPETIEAMFTNQLPKKASSRNFQFGLGFRIQDGTYFWGGAAGTRFWVDPKNKIVGVFMVQINPYRGRDYGREFKKAAYRALAEQGKEGIGERDEK